MGDEGTESDLAEQSEPLPRNHLDAKPTTRPSDEKRVLQYLCVLEPFG